jgi:hypothetical protein
LNLHEIEVQPVRSSEQERYQALMRQHHYLGDLPKISETVWYVAQWLGQWVALVSFSASALKCAARDQWIGWDFHHRYSRLKLIVNNSRFLILPDWHVSNLGSRVLALCERRLARDWEAIFGHGVLLMETFVDARRFRGTVYRAANWAYVGDTRGFRRIRHGYSATPDAPKMVFVKPLAKDARGILSGANLPLKYCTGGPRMNLCADHMQSLPSFFSEVDDPRRAEGRRHRLATILAIAAGAVLCGMRGYHGISDWAQSLGQKARRRFRCRRNNDGSFEVPSEYVIRNVLIRVDPAQLDRALQLWNETYAENDQSLAIDGKTMCNALDDEGRKVHIISVVGHDTKICHAQKKSVPCP